MSARDALALLPLVLLAACGPKDQLQHQVAFIGGGTMEPPPRLTDEWEAGSVVAISATRGGRAMLVWQRACSVRPVREVRAVEISQQVRGQLKAGVRFVPGVKGSASASNASTLSIDDPRLFRIEGLIEPEPGCLEQVEAGLASGQIPDEKSIYWIAESLAARVSTLTEQELTVGVSAAGKGDVEASVGRTREMRSDVPVVIGMTLIPFRLSGASKRRVAAAPTAPVVEEAPEPVAAMPEPEPVAVKPAPEPEPVAAKPEPEPESVATRPVPEPEPVATKPEPEPEPVATKPEPVATKPEPDDRSTPSLDDAVLLADDAVPRASWWRPKSVESKRVHLMPMVGLPTGARLVWNTTAAHHGGILRHVGVHAGAALTNYTWALTSDTASSPSEPHVGVVGDDRTSGWRTPLAVPVHAELAFGVPRVPILTWFDFVVSGGVSYVPDEADLQTVYPSMAITGRLDPFRNGPVLEAGTYLVDLNDSLAGGDNRFDSPGPTTYWIQWDWPMPYVNLAWKL